MGLNIIAKTSFTTLAVVSLVAVSAYAQNGDTRLLDAGVDLARWVIVGGVLIALIVTLGKRR